MTTVALVGTLDTKGEECSWIAQLLKADGVDAILVDSGSFSTSPLADVSSDEVIKAAGEDPVALRERRHRGEMMTVMGRGAAAVVLGLYEQGRIHGMLSIGGSGGSSVAATVMQTSAGRIPEVAWSRRSHREMSLRSSARSMPP